MERPRADLTRGARSRRIVGGYCGRRDRRHARRMRGSRPATRRRPPSTWRRPPSYYAPAPVYYAPALSSCTAAMARAPRLVAPLAWAGRARAGAPRRASSLVPSWAHRFPFLTAPPVHAYLTRFRSQGTSMSPTPGSDDPRLDRARDGGRVRRWYRVAMAPHHAVPRPATLCLLGHGRLHLARERMAWRPHADGDRRSRTPRASPRTRLLLSHDPSLDGSSGFNSPVAAVCAARRRPSGGWRSTGPRRDSGRSEQSVLPLVDYGGYFFPRST